MAAYFATGAVLRVNVHVPASRSQVGQLLRGDVEVADGLAAPFLVAAIDGSEPKGEEDGSVRARIRRAVNVHGDGARREVAEGHSDCHT